MDEKVRDETVSSASDKRTVNNLMRHQYRVLTDQEKEQMQTIKDKGLKFVNYLTSIGIRGTADSDVNALKPGQVSRELSIAQTKIEEAVMWAVKHVTG